jgi:quercetin dioxygenase-like cupin family protein
MAATSFFDTNNGKQKGFANVDLEDPAARVLCAKADLSIWQYIHHCAITQIKKELGPADQGAVMLMEQTDRQIENARVRVTRHRMTPGAHTGLHRHAHDYVIVPVTGGRMRLVEGGRESTAELAAGVAYFRAAGVEHDVINGGDQDLIFVEVEIVSA